MNEEEKIQQETLPERPDWAQELIGIIRGDQTDEEKRELLANYHAGDLADALETLGQEERRHLYRLIGKDAVSEVFAYLDDAGSYLEELGVETAADIVELMDADDAVDILEELDDVQKEAIIQHMEAEARADVRMIASYEDDEIGSLMTTNYIVIRRGLSIRKARQALVDQAADNDNLSTIYVVEEDERFHGAVALQDLLTAKENASLEDLVSTAYPFVYDHEAVATCIEELKGYSEDSIPVVDSERRLLGVITAQDLVEAVDDELGEDYAKLAGLTNEEDLNEPLLDSMKKRIPWLVILMFLGLLVSSVIGVFEEPVMAKLTIVVAFQSLILDMAGNVGTQSLAVTIRVLSDEVLTGRQKLNLVLKEVRVGLCNGLLLGTVAFVFVGLYIMLGKGGTTMFSFAVSGCIGIAMMVAMVISSLTGTLVPMFFAKIKVDPAVASGPLITTMNDLAAAVSYYGLVWVLLINVLNLAG